MTESRPTPSWRTWLQLLRAPNLFTVPGDPLAGFLLTMGGGVNVRLALAIGASLCFYSHGLLVNDLADLAEDRRERPNRPLPSGAASPRIVVIVAAILAVVGLAFCLAVNRDTLIIGFILLAAILVYNLWSKKIAVVGPLNMGACRGLSVILGATAGIQEVTLPDGGLAAAWSVLLPLAFFAGLGMTLYIAAVTHLARIETQANPPEVPRALPFVGLVAVVLTFFFIAVDRHGQLLSSANIWMYLISAYTLYAGFKIYRRLIRTPAPPIPPIIGQLIRLLLPLQALFCVASRSVAGGIAAAVLLLLWPVSRNVSRRFYAS
jgi:4-hydroxybenzoate polyprenyltransferase